MDIRRTVNCSRCNNEFPFDQVRFLPDRRRMACNVCLGIVEGEKEDKRRKEGRLFDFQCLSCHYMFRRTVAHSPKSCPQCEARELIKFDKSKLTSSKLLKLSDDPRTEKWN